MISGDYNSSNIPNTSEVNSANVSGEIGVREDIKNEAMSYLQRARDVTGDPNLSPDEKIKQLKAIKAQFEDWIQKLEESVKASPFGSAADLKALGNLKEGIGLDIDNQINYLENVGKSSIFDMVKKNAEKISRE